MRYWGSRWSPLVAHLGISFSGKIDYTVDSQLGGKKIGDQYAFIDSFSRARHLAPRVVWDMMHRDHLNWYEYKRYADTLAEYKRKYELYDFADMLVMGQPRLDVDVVIIDEAQDLSTAQWYFLENAFPSAQRIYIGGDDDQAIYKFQGANVQNILTFNQKFRDPALIVLQNNYRSTQAICDLVRKIIVTGENRLENIYPELIKKELISSFPHNLYK